MMSEETTAGMTRDQFLRRFGQTASLLFVGGFTGAFLLRTTDAREIWQIDPAKCNQCGQCETHCVLDQSAVKCFHSYPMCGYCELCTGFLVTGHNNIDEGAENQLCPVGAIGRRYVDYPYYEYTIDEALCIGCGKCVKGCRDFGNGSLYLQVRHDLCKNCNDCNIARHCPADAFFRAPKNKAYYPRPGIAS